MYGKNSESGNVKTVVRDIVIRMLHDIQNGSITIVKQDNFIIQINTLQITCFEEKVESGHVLEGILP